jgi:hypothetical protein
MTKFRTKSSSEIKIKGSKEKVPLVTMDINNLKERLTRLRNSGHKRIADLDENEKADYDYVVQVVGLFYGQAGYAVVAAEIKTVFAGVVPKEVGTVDAYIVGCLIPNDVLGGCNPLCAASLPLADVVQCNVQVIWANRVGNTYQFMRLSQGVDQSKAKVFFPVHVYSLSEEEKMELKNMGCESVMFYLSNTADNKYYETFKDYVSIDSIECRVDKKDNNWLWFIALIFVIFLLLLFVNMQRKRN